VVGGQDAWLRERPGGAVKSQLTGVARRPEHVAESQLREPRQPKIGPGNVSRKSQPRKRRERPGKPVGGTFASKGALSSPNGQGL